MKPNILLDNYENGYTYRKYAKGIRHLPYTIIGNIAVLDSIQITIQCNDFNEAVQLAQHLNLWMLGKDV